MIKDISFGDAFKCALGVTLGIKVGKDLSGVGGCAAIAIIKKIFPEEWALLLKEYEKEHNIKESNDER